jgi:hypothetical protein
MGQVSSLAFTATVLGWGDTEALLASCKGKEQCCMVWPQLA